jgi:hypothetical protein
MALVARIPLLAAAFTGAVVVVSLLAGISSDASRSLVLMPGNTVLGEHAIWNVFTFALVEPNTIKLILSLPLIARLAMIAESSGPQPLHRATLLRTLITVVLAVLGAGLFISMSFLMLYMSSGQESYLYRGLYGSGPLAAALSICAHQVAGDSPALPGFAPWLPVSALPLVVLATEALSQYVFRVSRCFLPTVVAAAAAWLYLRFFHVYAPGSVGDGRPCFEFLSLVPAPAQ